jgi:hypothetical protein
MQTLRSQGTFLAALALAALAGCADHNSQKPPPGQFLRQVSFETRAEIVTGQGSSSDAVLADLNQDGMLDLAVAALGDRVQVLLGGGNGTFLEAQTLTVAGRPLRIEAVDVDLDGDLDLVVVCHDAGLVRVLSNDGRAGFAERAALNAGSYAAGVAGADITGDGWPDLVVSRLGAPLSVFFGSGSGGFLPATELAIPGGGGGSGLALADVDGDGLLDLAVASPDTDRVVLYRGRTGGGFDAGTGWPVGRRPQAVAIGDLNGDGRADLAVACQEAQAFTLMLREGAAWRIAGLVTDGAPGDCRIADVTGDQRNDLVACLYDRLAVAVFEGLADGTLGEELQLGTSGYSTGVATGEVNGDGRPDLLATGGGNDRLSLFLGKPGGLYGSVNYATGLQAPEFVSAADFDGDGKAEIAVAGRGAPSVSFLRRVPAPPGVRELRPFLSVPVGRPVYNLAKGDFNEDGKPDLAVCAQGGVKLLANTSSGGGTSFQQVPADPDAVLLEALGPFQLEAADLDGDGLDDLVVSDAYSGAVHTLRALDRNFTYASSRVSVPVSGLPGGLAVADYSGDGRPDVAVSRNASGFVSILRNDGSGRLEPWLDVPVGAGPNYLRTADFDGDRRMDLVVSNAGVGEVTVLVSTGNGFRQGTHPAGATPTALLARDLNHDGRADILVASLSGADFRVLLGDGRGGFPVQIPFPGTYRATSADLADVDGDGLPDLSIASVETSRLSLYRNTSR